MSGVSMERFGPVSVDYYIQRRVLDVVDGQPGEGNPIWVIVLEGGATIQNFDPTIAKPTAIEGAQLSQLILGGHRDGQPVTELRFGLEQVILNPIEYAISDPEHTKGQLVYAQRSDMNMVFDPETPAEPEDRTAEGPDDE